MGRLRSEEPIKTKTSNQKHERGSSLPRGRGDAGNIPCLDRSAEDADTNITATRSVEVAKGHTQQERQKEAQRSAVRATSRTPAVLRHRKHGSYLHETWYRWVKLSRRSSPTTTSRYASLHRMPRAFRITRNVHFPPGPPTGRCLNPTRAWTTPEGGRVQPRRRDDTCSCRGRGSTT